MEKLIEITKPVRVEKTWGYEEIICNDSEYCGKLLRISKGRNGSMHYHLNKKETWYILTGKIKLESIDKENTARLEWTLVPGDVVTLNKGVIHKITGYEDSIIVEISTLHEDSDTYRVEPSS